MEPPKPEDLRGAHPRSGLRRREILQVGFSGLLGIRLSSVRAGRALGAEATSVPRAQSVLLIFLSGGPCQLDTFDPKPEAPTAIRGPFGTIATKVPGVRFCDLLPGLAARADRFALVRSMALFPEVLEASHEVATPLVLSGTDRLPPGVGESDSRRQWPCYAAGLEYLRPRRDGLPSGMVIPRPLPYLGSDAGLLGPRYDPWQLDFDPTDPAFGPEKVGLPAGRAVGRADLRRTLLDQFDHYRGRVGDRPILQQFSDHQRRAFQLLDSGRLASAFRLDREDPRVRDRYGRHPFGRTLLLARRLAQAGVPLIQANLGSRAEWDFHWQNEKRARALTPPMDQAVSALLDDLDASGLLDEVLVIMLGEFGRTPRINQDAGRDHWTRAFCAVFAGAGVRGGHVIGKTDRIAATCMTRAYKPSDIGATLYTALGVEPASEVRDLQGRPLQLNRGEVIAPLFA